MKKLRTVWNIIKTVCTTPGRLRLVVDHEKEFLNKIKTKYPDFINGLPVVDISEFITGKNDIIEPYTFLRGNSLPTDMALLRSIAKKITNCQYFEIGTWRGESVANIADVAEHCTTLNIPDDTLREKGLKESYVDMHRYFSKHLKNVTHLQHDSLTFDFSKYKNSLDLIFVDGDHHYHEVQSDTRNAFTLPRNESSVIVWHDYGFDPEHIRYEVLAGILDGCPPEKRPYLYHVSDTMCAVFIQKNFNTKTLQADQSPNKYFSVALSEKKIA